jgi:RNA 3'-terminal phosphate cyclase (ATP)
MKHAAIKEAVKNNIRCYIEMNKTTSFSPGTGITLWSKSNETVLGSTFLGEKGVTAEKIGEKASTHIINDIKNGATIDNFAIDQILPYMVLAQNESRVIVSKISNHTKTNMWLLKQFFNVEYDDKKYMNMIKLRILNQK